MDSFLLSEMNGTKMSALDVLSIMIQNGWEEAIPGWTTCRELFYDATYTHLVWSYVEHMYTAMDVEYEFVKNQFDNGTCCNFAREIADMGNQPVDWCTCVEIAQWWKDDYYEQKLSLERLLDAREEFLANRVFHEE